ncbi:MOSC domain-containing protein [Rhizobiales bacterium RZME27]|uniref:MOSC domain-containing protein n=1 Tax=Endobacterium cereale TaxID=2663029 RepID=A0A6A8AA09_9HYPH|nr:MOSC domain-containing protein [Endobacterium cereale]MEB2847896.1 MOSC domain-containing protein [Endobacterium cereale]MQY46768.1 MOSC domain-containing protein [Endobacterium cereale]
MKLLAICIGSPEKLAGKSYKTGINKIGVSMPVMIDREGVLGDAVCNGKYHGGPEQAVLLEGSLTIDWWSERLGRSLAPGAFGENLVIEGLDNRDVSAGDRFIIGDGLELQATSARTPCGTLAARMGDPSIVKTYRQAMRPGIYCRVLTSGTACAGDAVQHIRHDGSGVQIPEMLEKFGKRLNEADTARFLQAPIHVDMRAAILAGKPAKF